ncbi:MAG: hypothetical protein ACJ8CH_06050, partial [Microvirga sp.]
MIRRLLGLSAIALVIVLAGCGLSTDSEQSRICRSALPALNPDGRVRVLRIAKGELPRSLQIEYEV